MLDKEIKELSTKELEKYIICVLLMDNNLMVECLDIPETYFKNKKTRDIFVVIKQLFLENKQFDQIIISERANIEIEYLYDIYTKTITTINLKDYLYLLTERNKCDSLLKNISVKKSELENNSITFKEAIGSIEETIFRLSSEKEDKSNSISDISNRVYEDISTLKDEFIPTYINNVDSLIRGFPKGDLSIISGSTGTGKTGFALNTALKQAGKGLKVGFISLEMSQEQVCVRVWSIGSGVDNESIISNKMNDNERVQVDKVLDRLQNLSLEVVESLSTLVDLKIYLKKQILTKGLDILYIDYIGLMSEPSLKGNKTQEMSEISRGLKLLAMEYHIPIVALAQLNKEANRGNRRPTRTDIKDSSQIEQDASIILILFREDVHDHYSDKKGVMEVIVDKNRHGSVGDTEVKFIASSMQVLN